MMKGHQDCDLIKKEYFLLIRRSGGSIVFEPSSCVYLLVPAEIRKMLESDFGFNLRRDRGRIEISCELVQEVEGGAKLVYSFRRIRNASH